MDSFNVRTGIPILYIYAGYINKDAVKLRQYINC